MTTLLSARIDIQLADICGSFFKVNMTPGGILHMRRRRLKYKRHYKIPPEGMWLKWNDDEVCEWDREEHGNPFTSEKIRDNKFWVNFDRNKECDDENE